MDAELPQKMTRCPFAHNQVLAWLFAIGLVVAVLGLHGCSVPTKSEVNGGCTKNRDCAYGLECRDNKTCQYIAFADCDAEAVAQGKPACLNGQKCRDGKCTVFCASNSECKDGVCKVGVCVVTGKDLRQCLDNRDCVWPESCFHGQCVTHTDAFKCQTDLDCGLGYHCLNYRCQ